MICISDKSAFAYFHLYIANKLPKTDLTKRERRLARELARNDGWRKLLLKQPRRKGPTRITFMPAAPGDAPGAWDDFFTSGPTVSDDFGDGVK